MTYGTQHYIFHFLGYCGTTMLPLAIVSYYATSRIKIINWQRCQQVIDPEFFCTILGVAKVFERFLKVGVASK